MLALIDGDTPVFAAAISSEDQEEYIAIARMERSFEKIIADSGCDEHRIYVSGGNNFRKEIDPFYKANRPKVGPIHRKACHDYAIEHLGAIETDGYEADDAVGCEQNEDTMIVGIDKDLLMIPGKHYQWPITRYGKEIRPHRFHDITYLYGLRLFFISVLTGDKSDNILQWFDDNSQTWKKNKWALSEKKAAEMIVICKTEEEMYEVVRYHYFANNVLDELESVMDLLWIWRAYGETYSIRKTIYG